MKSNYNHELTPELRESLSKIKRLALDMDGTIYLGSTLFPFTVDFLDSMKNAGVDYSFLTNNPTKSVADYLKKLEGMGIHADQDNMYTTSLAAIDYIKSHYPDARRLFLLGTNPDRVCPTDQRTILVDCGSICRCIESASGRRPDITLGKPDPNMIYGIMDKYGLKPEEVAMVGDRIYTDTATAHNAGAFGVLVLSGETTIETALKVAEDAASNPNPEFYPPNLIVRDIKELGELILAARS